MDKRLLELLVDPRGRSSLQFHDAREGNVDGWLISPPGNKYPIVAGIPRFVLTEDAAQRQTQDSFGFKWHQRHTYGSPAVMTFAAQWFLSRYGFSSAEDMSSYMVARGPVLDAGCGAGLSTSLWLGAGGGRVEWIGADISSAIDVAKDRLADIPNTHFVQADISELPFLDATFGAIISEGVIHHTPSTERSFLNLARLLRPGGELMVYIYRKKSPLREFADDHVRAYLSELEPKDAWEELKPLTKLGQALGELNVEIDVPEAIPFLEIPAGRQNLQRFFYWHIAKAFWNPDYSFDENHHINFDWYHPKYAHRHTEEELREFCAKGGLRIVHLDAQESGFTVRAVRDR